MSYGDQRDRPGVGVDFYLAHGLGNDYLVMEEAPPGADPRWRATPRAVEALCHRLEGAGSDGLVVLLAPSAARGSGPGGAPDPGEAPAPDATPDPSPFRLRMFNPDGSEFERSGNGLRILASYLHRTGRVGGGGEPFRVEVGGDVVEMRVHGVERGEYDVSVEMGRARRGAEAVGLDAAVLDGERLTLDETAPLTAVTVSVGNPHCVVWGEPDPFAALERAALDRIGPRVATHEAFARGVNVQLARVVGPDVLEALVWERGVGHTTASGTSACAVAVSAVASGRSEPGEKEVVMEGGALRVRVGADLDVVLRGPVQAVCDGRLDAGFAARLGER